MSIENKIDSIMESFTFYEHPTVEPIEITEVQEYIKGLREREARLEALLQSANDQYDSTMKLLDDADAQIKQLNERVADLQEHVDYLEDRISC